MNDPVVQNSLCLKSVCNILQTFKISSRLQYFPEYIKDQKIDTIIVAYAINDHLIYSNKYLKVVENGGQPQLHLIIQNQPLAIDRIRSFQIFLPYIERKEIDYRKNVHSSGGAVEVHERNAKDFIPGNSITLFVRDKKVKGIPHLDTTVEKRILLKDDIYAHRPLVMLTPLLDSFECVDFRRFNRLNTNIPCLFSLGKEFGDQKSMIQDFSERFIRFEFSKDNERTIRRLTVDSKVFLKVLLGQDDENIVFRGKIFRIRKCFVVVALQNIMKDGIFQNIGDLDEIYIKSTMLGHNATLQCS